MDGKRGIYRFVWPIWRTATSSNISQLMLCTIITKKKKRKMQSKACAMMLRVLYEKQIWVFIKTELYGYIYLCFMFWVFEFLKHSCCDQVVGLPYDLSGTESSYSGTSRDEHLDISSSLEIRASGSIWRYELRARSWRDRLCSYLEIPSSSCNPDEHIERKGIRHMNSMSCLCEDWSR